jgi:DNA-binding SARP family transcriptional activator
MSSAGRLGESLFGVDGWVCLARREERHHALRAALATLRTDGNPGVRPVTLATAVAPAEHRAVRLIDGFECCIGGETVELPHGCQRLVAFLALWDRPVLRSFVSGSLWPDNDSAHSNACLRSSVWRLQSLGAPFVHVTPVHLALDPHVEVDYRAAVEWSRTVLTGADPLPMAWTMHEIAGLVREVLPDWYDEWVQEARERFRQLRLHALEQLCARLTSERRYGEAILAGLAAVAIEPLRESAHRSVIDVHLAEHNNVEALRQYRRYENVLRAQLALRPSAELRALVETVLAV